MKGFLSGVLISGIVCGCSTPKGVERGRSGTIAHTIQVEASEPGVKIETDGEYVGTAPTTIKIFGDKDATFHNFGIGTVVIRAIPSKAGQSVQEKVFHTGGWFNPDERIPKRIYFEMNLTHVAATHPTDGNSLPPRSDNPRGTGTGFFISDDGYILTCYHVIHGAQTVLVKIGKEVRNAEIVRKSQTADLAVLKVDAKTTGLPIGASRNVRLGERVYTIGFPLPTFQGQEHKWTEGSISSLAGFQDDYSAFQISAPVQPGNSGGPLVNEEGEIIGVIVAKLRGGENVNYAIKSSAALILLEQIPELKLKPSPAKGEKRSPADIADSLRPSTVMIQTY